MQIARDGLEGEAVVVSDLGECIDDRSPVHIALIGNEVLILKVVVIVHVQSVQAFFAEGADHSCRALAGKARVSEIQASNEALAQCIDHGGKLLARGAGVCDQLFLLLLVAAEKVFHGDPRAAFFCVFAVGEKDLAVFLDALLARAIVDADRVEDHLRDAERARNLKGAAQQHVHVFLGNAVGILADREGRVRLMRDRAKGVKVRFHIRDRLAVVLLEQGAFEVVKVNIDRAKARLAKHIDRAVKAEALIEGNDGACE